MELKDFLYKTPEAKGPVADEQEALVNQLFEYLGLKQYLESGHVRLPSKGNLAVLTRDQDIFEPLKGSKFFTTKKHLAEDLRQSLIELSELKNEAYLKAAIASMAHIYKHPLFKVANSIENINWCREICFWMQRAQEKRPDITDDAFLSRQITDFFPQGLRAFPDVIYRSVIAETFQKNIGAYIQPVTESLAENRPAPVQQLQVPSAIDSAPENLAESGLTPAQKLQTPLEQEFLPPTSDYFGQIPVPDGSPLQPLINAFHKEARFPEGSLLPEHVKICGKPAANITRPSVRKATVRLIEFIYRNQPYLAPDDTHNWCATVIKCMGWLNNYSYPEQKNSSALSVFVDKNAADFKNIFKALYCSYTASRKNIFAQENLQYQVREDFMLIVGHALRRVAGGAVKEQTKKRSSFEAYFREIEEDIKNGLVPRPEKYRDRATHLYVTVQKLKASNEGLYQALCTHINEKSGAACFPTEKDLSATEETFEDKVEILSEWLQKAYPGKPGKREDPVRNFLEKVLKYKTISKHVDKETFRSVMAFYDGGEQMLQKDPNEDYSVLRFIDNPRTMPLYLQVAIWRTRSFFADKKKAEKDPGSIVKTEELSPTVEEKCTTFQNALEKSPSDQDYFTFASLAREPLAFVNNKAVTFAAEVFNRTIQCIKAENEKKNLKIPDTNDAIFRPLAETILNMVFSLALQREKIEGAYDVLLKSAMRDVLVFYLRGEDLSASVAPQQALEKAQCFFTETLRIALKESVSLPFMGKIAENAFGASKSDKAKNANQELITEDREVSHIINRLIKSVREERQRSLQK